MQGLTIPELEAILRENPKCWAAYQGIRKLLNPELGIFWRLREDLEELHKMLHSSDR